MHGSVYNNKIYELFGFQLIENQITNNARSSWIKNSPEIFANFTNFINNMYFRSTLYWACRIPTSHKRSRPNLGVPCPCPDTSRRGNNCVAPTMWGVWRWLHGSQIWRHEGIGISPSQCELTRNEIWHTSSSTFKYDNEMVPVNAQRITHD